MQKPAVPHPRGCPRCFLPWRYESDGLGRLIPKHADRKCVAPKYASDEKEPDAPPPTQRVCIECEAWFDRDANAKKTCSDECRRKRLARQKAQLKERDRAREQRIRELWNAAA